MISSHFTVPYVCVLHTDQMHGLRKHEGNGHAHDTTSWSRVSHITPKVKCGVSTNSCRHVTILLHTYILKSLIYGFRQYRRNRSVVFCFDI